MTKHVAGITPLDFDHIDFSTRGEWPEGRLPFRKSGRLFSDSGADAQASGANARTGTRKKRIAHAPLRLLERAQPDQPRAHLQTDDGLGICFEY